MRMAFLFLGAIWLEQCFLPFLLPGRVSFRLVLLLVAALAIHRGAIVAASAGLLAGVVLSLLTHEPLGLSSLALCAVGWAGGEAALRFPLNAPPARVLLVFCLLVLEAVVTYSGGRLFFGKGYPFQDFSFLAPLLVSPLALRAVRRALPPPAAMG